MSTATPPNPSTGHAQGKRRPTAAEEFHDATMPLGEHFDELRKRLVYALLGLVPILVGSLLIGRQLLDLLIAPVQRAMISSGLSASMQATSPLETFYAYLRVSLVLTLLVGSPWVLWRFWQFVRPGLSARERRFVYVLKALSSALTLAGVVFLYTVIMPVILAFFIRFGGAIGVQPPQLVDPPAATTFLSIPILEGDPRTPEVGQEWINTRLNQRRTCIAIDNGTPIVVGTQLVGGYGIQQQYRVAEYIKLFLQLAIAFAIAFQTPVVVLLLGWAGLVQRETLVKYRKHAGMACALAGALLTPADPISMVLMAIPLYVLFELGLLLLVLLPAERVGGGLKKRGEEGDDAGDE